MVSLILFFEFVIYFSEISRNPYALRAGSSSQSIIKALTENMAVLPKITTIATTITKVIIVVFLNTIIRSALA